MASIGGLGSGLDTDSIVSQLMQLERLPQQRIMTRRTKALSRSTAWSQVNVAMSALKTAAGKLNTRALTDQVAATSSNTAVLGVSVGAGALAGAYTVRVSQLATAQSLTATNTFASPTAVVGAGSLVLQRGLAATGFTGVSAPAGAGQADTGNYTLEVTQASAAATATGAGAAGLAFGAGAGQTLTLAVSGGASTSITLDASYASTAALVTDAQTKLNASFPGALTVSADAAGVLSIATTEEGGSRSIAVSGGAAATLRLAAATVTGTSAKVSVNGATAVTVDPSAGTATLAGLALSTGALRVGKADVTVARTTSATATVSDLAAQVNQARGVAGATVISNAGATTFALSGTATGSTNAVTATTSGLTGFGGGFTSTAGKDSVMTVNGTTVTRSSNTVADVVPGVTFTLNKVDPADVAVTLAQDTAGLSTKAADLVKAINGVLSAVSSTAKYDAAAKRSGPLGGDTGARGLVNDVYSAVNNLVPKGSTTALTLGAVGIVLGKDGSYAVDDAKLQAAFAKDPVAAGNLIAQLGTALSAVATTATGPTGVTVLGREEAVAEAARLQKSADAYEPRLERTRSRYQRQFAALDKSLGSLRNQGSFLGGQLAGLTNLSQ